MFSLLNIYLPTQGFFEGRGAGTGPHRVMAAYNTLQAGELLSDRDDPLFRQASAEAARAAFALGDKKLTAPGTIFLSSTAAK